MTPPKFQRPRSEGHAQRGSQAWADVLRRTARRAIGHARGPRPGEARGLYLDLLEKSLLHTLYSPTDAAPVPESSGAAFSQAILEQGIELKPVRPEDLRKQGKDLPVYGQTMIGIKRLRNLRRCVQTVLADGTPGDLIEAGCWRGGASILMRGVLRAHGIADRTVWAADTFTGLPEPDPERYPADAGDLNYQASELAVPLEEVRANFDRYGLLDDQVRFLEGLFAETLPTVANHRWAVIRLDGDLYESTMDGLRNLYPGLSVGGFAIIDDYGWKNCREAVHDFRREEGISEPIERVDWVGAYWRRER